MHVIILSGMQNGKNFLYIFAGYLLFLYYVVTGGCIM